jgi:Alkylmercury lyase
MDFDTQVKIAVYRCFASTGDAPRASQLARELECSPADLRQAYARLRASRVLLLEPDGETIRMAPPFSGVPTAHWVEVGRQAYFANCAWDALGIPAALQQPAEVFSRCEQTLEPLHLRVHESGPEPVDCVIHFAVPAALWWKDIVFT